MLNWTFFWNKPCLGLFTKSFSSTFCVLYKHRKHYLLGSSTNSTCRKIHLSCNTHLFTYVQQGAAVSLRSLKVKLSLCFTESVHVNVCFFGAAAITVLAFFVGAPAEFQRSQLRCYDISILQVRNKCLLWDLQECKIWDLQECTITSRRLCSFTFIKLNANLNYFYCTTHLYHHQILMRFGSYRAFRVGCMHSCIHPSIFLHMYLRAQLQKMWTNLPEHFVWAFMVSEVWTSKRNSIWWGNNIESLFHFQKPNRAWKIVKDW